MKEEAEEAEQEGGEDYPKRAAAENRKDTCSDTVSCPLTSSSSRSVRASETATPVEGDRERARERESVGVTANALATAIERERVTARASDRRIRLCYKSATGALYLPIHR